MLWYTVVSNGLKWLLNQRNIKHTKSEGTEVAWKHSVYSIHVSGHSTEDHLTWPLSHTPHGFLLLFYAYTQTSCSLCESSLVESAGRRWVVSQPQDLGSHCLRLLYCLFFHPFLNTLIHSYTHTHILYMHTFIHSFKQTYIHIFGACSLLPLCSSLLVFFIFRLCL